MANKKRVLVVGSAKKSGGGVSTVIKLMEKMPAWEKYDCYWLGTQIQRNHAWKIWYAMKAYFIALFIIWRYDIVHFHTVPNISMKIQLPIFLLALIGKKKIVLHLHVGNQLEQEKVLRFKLFRWCMSKSDVIILLANKFKKMIENHYSDIKTPVTVLYNPCEQVDLIPYQNHEKTILFAGAFVYNKAVDILIDAFYIVHKKHPDWKLQLLGSGPDQSLYEEKINHYQLTQSVEIPGYLTGDEKKPYFQKAGIYALCSYMEGFPMVILEAWSYGIPVVTTPVGGLPDVIIEGANSLVFNFGNINELAEKLENLISNYKLREVMSEFSKNYVSNHFSMNVINDQIEHIYNNL